MLQAPCRICGQGIIRWRPNRRLCPDCAQESLRESKRLWQAQFRARDKSVYPRSEEIQRMEATYDETAHSPSNGPPAGGLGTGNIEGRRNPDFIQESRTVENELRRLNLKAIMPSFCHCAHRLTLHKSNGTCRICREVCW